VSFWTLPVVKHKNNTEETIKLAFLTMICSGNGIEKKCEESNTNYVPLLVS